MTATSVGILNLILGLVYTQYGTMTAIEMRRNWRKMGFSHFGAAWIAMAFTCGPHHFVHGTHVLFEGRTGGPLDLVAVLVGFPAGVIWFLLRLEGFFGGRGDRFVAGTPGWVAAIPFAAGIYVGIMLAIVAGSEPVCADERAAEPAAGRDLLGNRLLPGAHAAREQEAARRLVGVRRSARGDLPDLRRHARRLRLLHHHP